jgi:ubiquinone/menaquinone biosynthesis C-methylase UbiE
MEYPGNELELFSLAVNWKKYWTSRISSYIGDTVLEVGAGTGNNTIRLCRKEHKKWICLEPDKKLASELSALLGKNSHTVKCKIVNGKINDLRADDLFDTVLYIDVLEHIGNDREELVKIKRHIKPNGMLIILAPAHNLLYSNFDRSIGHYRRYNKRMLREIIPPCFEIVKMEYLDSAGVIASMANSLILKKTIPTYRHIRIWDATLIPASRLIDLLTFHLIGKSILSICQKIYRKK